MPASSLPPVLLYLPPEGAEVARALSGIAAPTVMETRQAFLAALSSAPWRAVGFLIEEDVGVEVLGRIAEAVPSAIVWGAHPHPDMDFLLDAEAAGAASVFSHPPGPDAVRELLEPYLTEGPGHPIPEDPPAEDRVVGSSAALAEAYRTVARVADSTASVLIAGESGTGKELVARALHRRSARREGPFVAVNCAALPEGLLEAELFGYERGAFTGAVGRSDGRFGRADGGTLFLDEVGEMGMGVQAKLLRALESGEIERLGSAETVRVDARVVAATNRDLEGRVREGAFREDLLFRMAVVRVSLPPLRDRMEDLIPLTEAFLSRFAERYGRPVHAISDAALEALRRRSWPGNVRELRNVLDRAVLLARGGVVRSIDLQEGSGSPSLASAGDVDPAGYPVTASLREVEERHMRRVLEHTGGHLGEAAEILGVHRNTMTAKVREYQIDPKDPKSWNQG